MHSVVNVDIFTEAGDQTQAAILKSNFSCICEEKFAFLGSSL